MLLSIGLPGAGHLYLRRWILGTLEMCGGLVLLSLALHRLGTVFIEALQGTTPPMALLRVCIPWALVIGAYSLGSGLFTWLISRRLVVLATPPEPSG